MAITLLLVIKAPVAPGSNKNCQLATDNFNTAVVLSVSNSVTLGKLTTWEVYNKQDLI